jgi:bromodomain adjacent to zinc finger domain protein 1A
MSALGGEKEEEPAAKTNGNGNGNAEASSTRASSLDSLSDVEGSEAGSTTGKANGKGKDKDLRKKLATTERQVARAKAKDAKAAAAELRRLEDEVAKADRRLEAIEREFRRFMGVTRVRPLGRDRFYNRVWWFDGLGSANLIGQGGTVMYGAGRLFVQGPSEFDVELLERREREEKDVVARRPVEEGQESVLGVGQWAVYETVDEVEALSSPVRRGAHFHRSGQRIPRLVEPQGRP